jgi:drug/metabolite transporter (DMT)-like permease
MSGSRAEPNRCTVAAAASRLRRFRRLLAPAPGKIVVWIALSTFAAFCQALYAAIKKKSLQTSGMNNVIGFVSFTLAGLIFGAMQWTESGTLWRENLSLRFWEGMAGYAGLNILAAWFLYRALDLAEFNHLMPFMTLTSLAIVIPPIFVFGEVPTLPAVFGIGVVVAGAVLMSWHKETAHTDQETAEQRRRNHQGVGYFLVTACCYTFSPTAAKEAIRESSMLFASFLVHILIGLGFLVMIIVCRESGRLLQVFRDRNMRLFLVGVAVTGGIIALENGSVNAALSMAPVASVMAIKRLMPLFAFLIGYFYFRERNDLRKKLLATGLMILGAILVTISK